MDKAIAFLVETSDLWMDGFHDDLGMVKTASIKVKYLCYKSSLRSLNFVIKSCMASCFLKGKPRRLCLLWAIGADIIIVWRMELPPWLKDTSTTWSKRDQSTWCQSTRRLRKKFPQKLEELPYIMLIVRASGNSPLIFKLDSANPSNGYVRRFIENSKQKRNSQPGKELPIGVFELREASHCWFRFIQKAHFSKQWSTLSRFRNPVH
jgi:hypothetical protein